MKNMDEIRDALYEIKRDTKRMQMHTNEGKTILRVMRLQLDALLDMTDAVESNELTKEI